MRFLIVSQYAGSARHGMVLRNYNWARALTDMGHEVCVVASSYSHSRGVQPQAGRQMIDGIEYIWLRGVRYDPAGQIGRVLAMLVFTAQLFFLRLRAADVVVASSPQPFVIYAARLYAKRWGAKLVFDARDMWPLTIKLLGGVSARHPFIWLMQKAEDYACRVCDLLVSVSVRGEDYFRTRGLAAGKFLHIANGVADTSLKAVPLPDSHADILRGLKAQGAFVVGYAGAMGLANALHVLIAAMADAPAHVHAVLMGRGPHLDALKQQAEGLGVSGRVHFLPSVEPEQVDAFLQMIDVGYLGFTKSDLYRYGASPTKLNDYMRAQKPILYAFSDADNPVAQSGGGIVCESENAQDVAAAMHHMAGMTPAALADMGARGRAWLLANHMVPAQMARLLAALG